MKKWAYYNDNDPYVCQWVRNLMAAGYIMEGEVDERSIWDVRPSDLRGFTRVHMFCGIAVWDYALRLAGWPDDRPVWTGSAPCQPFSAAGKGGGFADERHLWPAWFWLIEQCRPGTIFGEQVESLGGRAWLDLVFSDLEGIGYTCGAVDTPAAGFGAPHIRQRFWWVADAPIKRCGEAGAGGRRSSERPGDCGEPGGVADPEVPERRGAGSTDDARRRAEEAGGSVAADGVAHTERDGGRADESGGQAEGGTADGWTRGFWSSCDWLPCRDGKARPVEPGTFPLATIPAKGMGRDQSRILRVARGNRVGRLRGYGNALVAEQARAFIRSYIDVLSL